VQIFFIFQFDKIRIILTGVVSFLSSPRCRLSSSRDNDVVTLLHHVTLLSHGPKTCSLHPIHLPVMLRFVVSALELKSKHLIYTTAVGHPP
jgi:hypothetical protein